MHFKWCVAVKEISNMLGCVCPLANLCLFCVCKVCIYGYVFSLCEMCVCVCMPSCVNVYSMCVLTCVFVCVSMCFCVCMCM